MYGMDSPASEDEVFIEGTVCWKIKDAESHRFCFGFSSGGIGKTADDVVQKITDCDELFGMAVFAKFADSHGVRHDRVYFSRAYENAHVREFLRGFLQSAEARNSFLCSSFEDVTNFQSFVEYYGKDLHADLPEVHPGLSKERLCLRGYKPGRPIVFLSSGCDRFRSAGAFLCALYNHEAWNSHPRLTFLFSALSESNDGEDFKEGIVASAAQASCDAALVTTEDLARWGEVYDQCVQTVSCNSFYKGEIIFAQDAANILEKRKAHAVTTVLNDKEIYDVLVGFLPGDISAYAYRQSAYMLFKELQKTVRVGCITGKEEYDEIKDRSEHTLLCVTSRDYDDEDARDFGACIACKLGYKGVQFIACDEDGVVCKPDLILESVRFEYA